MRAARGRQRDRDELDPVEQLGALLGQRGRQLDLREVRHHAAAPGRRELLRPPVAQRQEASPGVGVRPPGLLVRDRQRVADERAPFARIGRRQRREALVARDGVVERREVLAPAHVQRGGALRGRPARTVRDQARPGQLGRVAERDRRGAARLERLHDPRAERAQRAPAAFEQRVRRAGVGRQPDHPQHPGARAALAEQLRQVVDEQPPARVVPVVLERDAHPRREPRQIVGVDGAHVIELLRLGDPPLDRRERPLRVGEVAIEEVGRHRVLLIDVGQVLAQV